MTSRVVSDADDADTRICFSSPVFVGDTVLDEQRRFPEKRNEFIYFFDPSMIDIFAPWTSAATNVGRNRNRIFAAKTEILVNIISFGQRQQHCGRANAS